MIDLCKYLPKFSFMVIPQISSAFSPVGVNFQSAQSAVYVPVNDNANSLVEHIKTSGSQTENSFIRRMKEIFKPLASLFVGLIIISGFVAWHGKHTLTLVYDQAIQKTVKTVSTWRKVIISNDLPFFLDPRNFLTYFGVGLRALAAQFKKTGSIAHEELLERAVTASVSRQFSSRIPKVYKNLNDMVLAMETLRKTGKVRVNNREKSVESLVQQS
jgi:hypothetical protein